MIIKTRQDLHFFLEEDRKRNKVPSRWFTYFLKLMAGCDYACVYRYIKCLRHLEYYKNNSSKSFFHKIFFYYYAFLHKRLGLKYNMSIGPNMCGYGLRIMHLSGGGGVLLNIKKSGNYCGFNAGVLIGNNGSQENRPTLGDHVAFGPGAKAFGKITIGNNVFVAPNAVVNKDVPDNCIVGGIPAKIIKERHD